MLMLLPFQAAADAITVASASSLRPVLEQVILVFKHEHAVRTVYAASGTLVQQILHGAPYEVFLSASPDDLKPLQQAARICEGPAVIGHGRLVLYVPQRSQVPLDATLKALGESDLQHLAIADPAIAPFGRLAKQALENARLWQSLQDRLVFGDSAARTAQLVLAGAVDAALLPKRLMQPRIFAQRGRWVGVDESLYRPMPMMAVWLCGSSHASRALYFFLRDHFDDQ